MILRTFLPSKRDLELLFGFRLTPIRALALTTLGILALFERPSGDVLLAEPLTIIAGVMAAGMIAGGIMGSAKAGKAAKEAAKPSAAELALKEETDKIQTDVDRAHVETAISQAATPIGGALQQQQQDILQQDIVSGGGSGVPGMSGRTMALQRQLTEGASEGVAQAALGAQGQAEQAALVRKEMKLGGQAQLGCRSG